MRPSSRSYLLALLLAVATTTASAQGTSPSTDRVIRMSGALPVAAGQPAGASASVDFSIYDAESGGALLWQETQVLAVDASGAYSVLLGASSPDGLPADLFAGGAARWLTVNRTGAAPGQRTLLTAVPYAMSAVNADTLGGRPATDFMLVPSARSTAAGAGADAAAADDANRDPRPLVNNGTTGFIGKFFNTVDLDNSLLFQSGSNVGVGTTTPLDALHTRFLNTAGTATGYAVQNLGNTANSYSGMLFYDHTGTLRQFQGYNNGTGEYRINNISPTASINFMTGSVSRFLVDNSGQIGLGATSPATKLHLLSTSQNGVTIRGTRISGSEASPSPTVSGNHMLLLEGTGYNTASYQVGAALRMYAGEAWTPTAQGSYMSFDTTVSGTNSLSEKMRIHTNGNVGIGTNTPDVRLEVAGDVRATGGNFQPLDTGSFGVRWVNTSGTIQAHMHRFSVDSRLYVTNSGGLNLTGVYLADGATTWTSTSDERLKRNITPLAGLLGKIKGIRVAAYDMAGVSAGADGPKVDTSKTHHEVGSIAQDWLKDFPELVVKPKSADQFYGLNYDRIGVVALGAVQELNAVVEQKDAEIKSLTERIAALEAALKSLATAVQQQR